MSAAVDILRQHLIDPEICIRCNTCEETCPIDAITHDSRNYVVDPSVCNACNACIAPCPTGAIDNWRSMPKSLAYPVAEQLGWDVLPAEMTPGELAAAGVATGEAVEETVALAAPSVLAATVARNAARWPRTTS